MTEPLKFEFHKLLHAFYCSLVSLDELKTVWMDECSSIYPSHSAYLDKALERWFHSGETMLVDEIRAALTADGVVDQAANQMANKLDASIWYVIRSREDRLVNSMN